jgi:hypothetical protein
MVAVTWAPDQILAQNNAATCRRRCRSGHIINTRDELHAAREKYRRLHVTIGDATLREARDQIVALKEEVDWLAQPPSGFGVFLYAVDDDIANVFTGGPRC